MGKTRVLCKKIGDIKGIFHTKMSMIKDRKNKYWTEKKRLRRGGKNTQKNYIYKKKKGLNHHGVVIHLEPDILEYEVKWALRNIAINKASGGNNSSWAIQNPKRWCY